VGSTVVLAVTAFAIGTELSPPEPLKYDRVARNDEGPALAGPSGDVTMVGRS